jgi:hypothetical protein
METAWLIEREVPGDSFPIQYLAISQDSFFWTHRVDDALRMAREADAKKLIELYGDKDAKAVEHGW